MCVTLSVDLGCEVKSVSGVAPKLGIAQRLLEEDRVVGSSQAETSLLIIVLRFLVLIIHQKHNGFGVGQQVNR
jgi:hypothetical protein